MNAKLKLYKEICLFIKQNGRKENNDYIIDFDDKVYTLTPNRGLMVFDETIETYYQNYLTVKRMNRDGVVTKALPIHLAKIMRDLKMNIDKFLKTK